MSRTPCNAFADQQGATDPWLKTPVLDHLQWAHVQLTSVDYTFKSYEFVKIMRLTVKYIYYLLKTHGHKKR